ncbi:MAG: DUF1579 domain-containing protein [Bacteroidota bacterium]
MQKWFRIIQSIIIILAIAGTPKAFGQDKDKPQSPESQEMMKKWMEAMSPGEFHKKLDAFVGSWSLTESIWMAEPGAPIVTKGSAEIKWTLDGRFIQQELDGTMMGSPMHGIGYTGYDNINKHYVSFWIDNTSTAMTTADGIFNQDGTVLTTYGKMDEPTTGEHNKNIKYIWKIIDKDNNVFEIHDLSLPEPNTKIVEVAYTRKK